MLAHLKPDSIERRRNAARIISTSIIWPMRKCWRRYRDWNRNRVALLALLDRDDRMLKDIGITRLQISSSRDQGLIHATRALQKHSLDNRGEWERSLRS